MQVFPVGTVEDVKGSRIAAIGCMLGDQVQEPPWHTASRAFTFLYGLQKEDYYWTKYTKESIWSLPNILGTMTDRILKSDGLFTVMFITRSIFSSLSSRVPKILHLNVCLVLMTEVCYNQQNWIVSIVHFSSSASGCQYQWCSQFCHVPIHWELILRENISLGAWQCITRVPPSLCTCSDNGSLLNGAESCSH